MKMPKLGDVKPKRRIALGLAVIAGLVGILYGIGLVTDAAKRKEGARGPVLVTEAVATTKSMPRQLTTIGHIEAIASVAVRPRIDGQITQVHVEGGQAVKTGDVLFTLDDRQARAALDQAKATLARDIAQREYAQHEVERQKTLAKKNYVSRSQYDQAKSTAAALDGTVASDEAMVADAEARLSFTVITAPIDGRLGTINFREGNTVQAASTTPLVTINQLKPIYAAMTVPQHSFPALQKSVASGAVPVTAHIPSTDEQPVAGTIAYVENAIDANTGTLGVRGIFANEDERLLPGQFVNLTITLGIDAQALVIPSAAVQPGQSGDYVYVISADSTVELRSVTVDRTMGAETIIARGLKDGERVVLTGQLRLTPGAKVTIKKTELPKVDGESS